MNMLNETEVTTFGETFGDVVVDVTVKSAETKTPKRERKIDGATTVDDFLMGRLYRNRSDKSGYKTTKLVRAVKAYCEEFNIDYNTLTVERFQNMDRDWLISHNSFGVNTMKFLENSMKNAGYRMKKAPTIAEILSVDVFLYHDGDNFVIANSNATLGMGKSIEKAITGYRASVMRA